MISGDAMKLTTALLAASLLGAGATAALAAGPEAETTTWIVGTRGAAASERAARTRPVQRLLSVEGYAAEMTADEAAVLRHSPDIRYVERAVERHLYRARQTGPRLEAPRQRVTAPASARSAMQTVPYGIDLVRARDLWRFGRGEGIKVVVIDTGVDYRHPDLKKIYKGGKDLINKDNDPLDDHGHGTHVAGTIAAADDQTGVVGIAPEIDLYAVKVLDEDGNGGSSFDIVRAIDWAVANGMDIMNLSLGGSDFSLAEQEAFANALAAGVLAVAASGNDYAGVEDMGYPAGYPSVVAVGAIDESETIAAFSQRGTNLALVGPGVNVTSTYPLGTASIADVALDGDYFPETGALEGTPYGELASAWVDCGLGKPNEFPASVAGKIALIKRGELTFNEKARNALAAGALGVVIYNHENSALHWTLVRSDSFGNPIEDVFPPTAAISKSEGEAILRKPGSTITLAITPYDYQVLQGTSMATPHVAGVAALVWSLAPTASAVQVRDAVTNSGRDLGLGGWDSTYGFGVVDAMRAARSIAPEVFGAPPRRRTSGR
jgi:subtilisin family serine protease